MSWLRYSYTDYGIKHTLRDARFDTRGCSQNVICT